MPGFTAIELLIVVMVVAILATLALPSFNSVVARYRVRTAVEDVTATIYFARSEAIKRGGGVVLRKSTQAGCSAPEAKNWSCGWMVYADLNGNGTYEPNADQLLQSTPAPRGVAVSNNNGTSYLRLNQWGEISGMGALGVVIGPAGNADAAKKTFLCLSAGGRLQTGAGDCSG
ncbi:GspH/FimT family pseudopilin [Variovorax robiniae]|uniref:Type II secretion system protein H n=1 Tax=Variovorax robiniae TaxID=1836199 RepID=A0ABU8X9W4_9BURK